MSPLAYWLYPQRCPASIGLVILRNRHPLRLWPWYIQEQRFVAYCGKIKPYLTVSDV
jgi:hypothetical protein